MFDLNAIVNAAITEAVNTRITEVLAQHANIVGGLAERIAALEDKLSMLTNHGVKTFENVDALTTRVVALEGDVSHKVQVQQANIVAALAERIAALETKLTEANLFTQMTQAPSVLAAQYTPVSNDQIKAALQEWATKDALVEHLDNQEWFWEKLQNRIDAATESAIDMHCETYDHDDYDRAVSAFDDMPALDDFVTRDSVREEIEDVLNNATLSLSI